MLTTSINPSRLAFCDDTHGMPVLRTGQRHIQCVIELKKISALLASIFGTMGRRRTVLSPCCNYTCHPKAGSTERNYNEDVGFFRIKGTQQPKFTCKGCMLSMERAHRSRERRSGEVQATSKMCARAGWLGTCGKMLPNLATRHDEFYSSRHMH